MKLGAKFDIVVYIFVILGVAIFFGNTLGNGFIHDDHGQVETNTTIKSLANIPKVVTSCIWESAVENCKNTYYYRPLQTLSYMLTYQLSSQPWLFHLVNLIYFSLDLALIYILARKLTKNTFVAILCSLLFLIHPLNTETVNWIATVPELLYLLFILLSTVLFLNFRETGRIKFLTWLLVTFGLGIASKEPAAFLPFVFLYLDFFYFKTKIRNLFSWKVLRPYILCLGIFAVYMIGRVSVLGGLGQDPGRHFSLTQHAYIFIQLFGDYLKHLFWPLPLNLFYPYVASYSLNLSFAIAALIFTGFATLFFLAVKNKWTIVGFALIWYLVFLAPSLIFVSSIGENLFAERHVFASTFGFVLIVSMLLNRVWKIKKYGKIIVIILVGVLTIASFSIINKRNKVWKSDELIYKDTLIHSPDADLIRYNLALVYQGKGRVDLAREQLNIIIKKGSWPWIYKVYNNLGDFARREGKFNEAVSYFEKAINLNPYHAPALNNLGAFYLERGDLVRSVLYLCKANQVDPYFADSNKNLDYFIQIIKGMNAKNFAILSSQLTDGKVFKNSPTPPHQFVGVNCAYKEGCLFTFKISFDEGAFPLSFLAAAMNKEGNIAKPIDTFINLSKGEVSIGMGKDTEKEPLKFVLPLCSGEYYLLNTRE